MEHGLSYANDERWSQYDLRTKKRTKVILNNKLLQDNDVSRKNNEWWPWFTLTNQTIHNDDDDNDKLND